jgi:hypothetical protein
MNESIKEMIRASQRLRALGKKITRAEWLVVWERFSALQDKHLASGEGLLDLEPLAMLEPGIGVN